MSEKKPRRDPFALPTPAPQSKKPPQLAKPWGGAPTAAKTPSPDAEPTLVSAPPPTPKKRATNFVFDDAPPAKVHNSMTQAATMIQPGGPAALPSLAHTMASYTHLPTQDLSGEKLLMPAKRARFNNQDVPALGGVPLIRKLGQGGMGAVYLGWHEKEQREVAVKILPFHMADHDPQMTQRFFREAALTAKIKSPNLVSVSDAKEENGLCYLLMEFVDGDSAGGYLKKNGRKTGIAEAEALEICIAATLGLMAAHHEGIIHRDIKPDNILIPKDASGNLDFAKGKLADLGLARTEEHGQSLTASQTAMGTPGYLAPEQAVDARKCGKPADIFSMGATLYALLTGRPPFHGKAPMETIMKTMNDPHDPVASLRPDVTPATSALIDRCLAKQGRERFRDAEALLRALKLCRTVLNKPEEQNNAIDAIRVKAAEIKKAPDEQPFFDELTYMADARPKRAEVSDIELENQLRARENKKDNSTPKLIAALLLAGCLGAGVAILAMKPDAPPPRSPSDLAKAKQETDALREAAEAPDFAAPDPATLPEPTRKGPKTKADEAMEAMHASANSMQKLSNKLDKQFEKAKIVEPLMPVSSVAAEYEDPSHFTATRVMFAFFASVMGLAYVLYSRRTKGMAFGVCGAILMLSSWLLPGLGFAVMLCGVCLSIPLFTMKA